MIVKNLKLTMILLRAPTIITVICPVAQSLTATGQILKRFPIILCLLEDQRVAIIRSSVEPDLEKHTHRQREGESINSLWWSYIKLAWMRGSKEGQNTEKGDAQVRSWGFVVWFHVKQDQQVVIIISSVSLFAQFFSSTPFWTSFLAFYFNYNYTIRVWMSPVCSLYIVRWNIVNTWFLYSFFIL